MHGELVRESIFVNGKNLLRERGSRDNAAYSKHSTQIYFLSINTQDERLKLLPLQIASFLAFYIQKSSR